MTAETNSTKQAQRLVRMAARALGRAGLVHAYGHCSMRLDEECFLVCAAKPMGSIKTGDAGIVTPVNGPLPEGVLGEVRIHQQIYRRRPDVGGICRVMPPHDNGAFRAWTNAPPVARHWRVFLPLPAPVGLPAIGSGGRYRPPNRGDNGRHKSRGHAWQRCCDSRCESGSGRYLGLVSRRRGSG